MKLFIEMAKAYKTYLKPFCFHSCNRKTIRSRIMPANIMPVLLSTTCKMFDNILSYHDHKNYSSLKNICSMIRRPNFINSKRKRKDRIVASNNSPTKLITVSSSPNRPCLQSQWKIPLSIRPLDLQVFWDSSLQQTSSEIPIYHTSLKMPKNIGRFCLTFQKVLEAFLTRFIVTRVRADQNVVLSYLD